MSVLKFSDEILRLNSKKRSTHRCNFCKFWSTSLSSMVIHMRRHRTELNSFSCEASIEFYRCDYCDFTTNLLMTLKKHQQEQHALKQQFKEERRYFCENCPFSSYFALDRLKHACPTSTKIETCYEGVYIKVEVSDEAYVENRGHRGEVRNILWRKCGECDYKTKLTSHLKQHIRYKHLSVDQVRWFQCDQCECRSKSKSNLAKHKIVKHLSDKEIKWFKCDKCEYKAKLKSWLMRHVKLVHSNDFKWFCCDSCDFRAKEKTMVSLHRIRKHLRNDEIEWYECDKCFYKGKLKASLTRHMKMRHADKNETQTWECGICDFKATTKAGLTDHINLRHATHSEMQKWSCKVERRSKKHLHLEDHTYAKSKRLNVISGLTEHDLERIRKSHSFLRR